MGWVGAAGVAPGVGTTIVGFAGGVTASREQPTARKVTHSNTPEWRIIAWSKRGEGAETGDAGRYDSSTRNSTVPKSTVSPFLTQTSATVPLHSALISLKIFIASIMQIVVSGFNAWPTLT